MFTEKGKRAGICDAWKTFKTFYSDVRPTYRRGLVLRRPDVDKPISPDNFIWVDPKDAAFFKSNTIQLEYNGEVHSIRDWAIIANTTVSAISIRYHRHKDEWPMERIIFGKKVHRGIKKPRNATSKQDERNKASRMISAYKHLDKERGFDLCNFDVDWMIENILHKCCVYCGDTNKLGCDRIDNNKGHTKDNVVPCCFECNTVRNNYFTYAEMRRLGALIKQIKEERAGIAPRPVR